MNQVLDTALNADKILISTHPVQVVVPDPDQLIDLFDMISYSKGSAICRMLKAFIGD
jgi:aminopeptidase 2